MRTLLFVAALTVAAGAQASTSLAADIPVRFAVTNADTAATVRFVADEPWRFKQFNGRWWYYTPQNYWLYHNGDTWIRYQPNRVSAPRRPYEYPRETITRPKSDDGRIYPPSYTRQRLDRRF